MFAREPIAAGEVVAIWGGVVMTPEEVLAGLALPHSIVEIGEGVLLASLRSDAQSAADFMNHSCDPNIWMLDEVMLAARRDIAPGEEATIDYALWGSAPPWERCACESSLCRGRVTSEDWRAPALQERYEGHWSPYISERIWRQSVSN